MSAYPIVVEGRSMSAVIIGGGGVGTRRAIGMCEAGVKVTVVAPIVSAEITKLARSGALVVVPRAYTNADLDFGDLVVVATDDSDLNAEIVRYARSCNKLVNAADDAEQGNVVIPAVHRAGDLTIAVSAHGVPAVAVAVRNAIAERYGDRYAATLADLRALRTKLLAEGKSAEWSRISERVKARLCDDVERAPAAEIPSWR